jgi:hypothetical protein
MTKQKQEEIITNLQEEIKVIRDRKGSDYANEDVLSNFKLAGSICGLSAEQNCLNQIATKVARLGNLLKEDKTVKNEPIQDSIIDLINYGYLLYCLLKDGKPIIAFKPPLKHDKKTGKHKIKENAPLASTNAGYVVVFSNSKGRYIIEKTRIDVEGSYYRGRKIHKDYEDCEKECNYLNVYFELNNTT